MTVVGVDLGKTGCRAQAVDDGVSGPVVEAGGAVGLADPGGAEQAFAAVRAVVDLATSGRAPAAVVVGAAGAEAAPDEAGTLAARLAELWPGAVVGVTSDSVTAHAGALAGAPGTVLAVGTGSVALGVSGDGRAPRSTAGGPGSATTAAARGSAGPPCGRC